MLNPIKIRLGKLLRYQLYYHGFILFYKKTAKESADRELFNLRFGSNKENSNGMFNKLLNLFRFKRGDGDKKKDKKSTKGISSNLGWISSIIGLVSMGLKLFGKQIGKLALKGLGSLSKLIGKGLWKLVSFIGKYALKGVLWVVKSLGRINWKGYWFFVGEGIWTNGKSSW